MSVNEHYGRVRLPDGPNKIEWWVWADGAGAWSVINDNWTELGLVSGIGAPPHDISFVVAGAQACVTIAGQQVGCTDTSAFALTRANLELGMWGALGTPAAAAIFVVDDVVGTGG
jgi:hypothetical protein